MPHSYSVFDTNIYRSLGQTRLSALLELERLRSVAGIASFYTVLELCGHLSAPSDPDAGSCHAAIKKLWTHCSVHNGQKQVLRITGDRESIVANIAFGRAHPEAKAAGEAYGYLVAKASSAATLADLAPHRELLEAAATDVVGAKEGWKANILNGRRGQEAYEAGLPGDIRAEEITRSLEFARGGRGRSELASSIVAVSAENLGIRPTPEEHQAAVERVMRACGVAIHYFDRIILKELLENYDATRPDRLTAGLDYLTCYTASPLISADRASVRLVSNDAAIKAAAVASGNKRRVLTLDEYFALLATGSDEELRI